MALDEKPSGPPSTTGTLTGEKETTVNASNNNTTTEKHEHDANNSAEDDNDTPEPSYLSGFALFRVMFGLVIVMLLAMLDVSIISTVSPFPLVL